MPIFACFGGLSPQRGPQIVLFTRLFPRKQVKNLKTSTFKPQKRLKMRFGFRRRFFVSGATETRKVHFVETINLALRGPKPERPEGKIEARAASPKKPPFPCLRGRVGRRFLPGAYFGLGAGGKLVPQGKISLCPSEALVPASWRHWVAQPRREGHYLPNC